jgi:hypothetical protein
MCCLPLRGLLYVELSILNHEYYTRYSFQADVHVFGYWSIVANFVEKDDRRILIFHHSYCLLYNMCSFKHSSV